MLKLRLPRPALERLRAALVAAGDHEIGGVLVGEHLGENDFALVDLSIQQTPGTQVCFVRIPAEHADFIHAFHARTNCDYTRFNYLGEWHSHPRFPAVPSGQDERTMQAIVDDESEPAAFAVLLVVRLGRRRQLQVGATLFQTGIAPTPIELEIDDPPSALRRAWIAVTGRLARRPTHEVSRSS